MNKISALSFSVLSSFKRVFIVLYSVYYFGRSLNLMNYLGIIISLCGLIFYNIANVNNKNSISKRIHKDRGEIFLV